jgi:hypothetical protein
MTMTVLGKTLVFFNLVFSLITGALVLMVYHARTNWAESYSKLDAQAKVAVASTQAYQKEAEEARIAADKQVAEIKASLDASKGQLDIALRDRDIAKDGWNTDRLKFAQLENNFKTVQAERDSRAKEVDLLKRQYAASEIKVTELVKQVSTLHDQKVNAEILAKATLERNSQLAKDLEEKSNKLRRLEIRGVKGDPTEFAKDNPPPENVEGLIKKSDPTTGLVTLSIGSDSGLARGHTLEVFRLDPAAKYICKIRILDVRPHEAVGKPIAKTNGPINVGDHVAKDILGGGK